MIPDGQIKRKPGNVWAQLLLSACALLLPPLLMVAGVMYLGSSSESSGQKIGAERADERPELATSLALLSAEQRPVIDQSRLVAEGPASSTQKQITKDSTRYNGRITVGDGSNRSPAAEVETPQAAAVADLSSKVPEQWPTERRRLPARSAIPYVPDTVAAVEAANPTASAHPGSNASGSWVVQLSAQRTEEEARAAFRAAQAKYAMLSGQEVMVRKKDQGGRGVFYAAQIGPLTRDEANGLCSRIKSAGGNCFIQAN
jgi:cell division septation protein DedD